MVRIGVQTSISGGVHRSVDRLIEKTGNCGQMFSHSPQSWSEPNISEDDALEFQRRREENDIDPWVIHTSYLVNLCSPKDDLRSKSIDSVQMDLDAADRLGIELVNTHLGAHTGAGEENGLQNAVDSINQLDISEGVELLIETDSGSGTNLGCTFEQLEWVKNHTDHQIGFCIDTAHIWAAGYDISSSSGVDDLIDTIESTVGMDSIRLIHMNDSKHDINTNRDEHQHLGDGMIGYDGIKAMVGLAGRNEIPMIAETPITDSRGDPWNLSTVRAMWLESKD